MTVDACTEPERLRISPARVELFGGFVAQLCLITAVALLDRHGLDPVGWGIGIAVAVVTDGALLRAQAYFGSDRLDPADWVTFARASLTAAIAALVADSFAGPISVWLLVSLAVVALVLDSVDGRIARSIGQSGRLGLYFDGEVDALLMLVLSVYVARLYGAWVLAIGAMRYAFLIAWLSLPWMRRPLPPHYWRKVVTAAQGVTLTVAAAAVLPASVTRIALLGALAMLSESFGRDVWWLRARRPRAAAVDGGPGVPASGPGAPAGSSRHPVRTAIGIAATVLAVVILWVALVAPYRPTDVHLADFLRIPLELLVVAAVALVLPKTPRRIFAVLAGVLLALLIVLKAVNYETYVNFDRGFQPIGDLTQFNNVLFTLRATIGRSETEWLFRGVVIGIVVAVVLMTVCMLRVTSAAAQNRRVTKRAVIGLGAVWVVTWLFGVGFAGGTPVASSLTAGLFANQINTVVGEIKDKSVFAAEIKQDPVARTPNSRLLTALHGKDVLLVFLEAYGQVAVKGKSFSPGVDAALGQGNTRLRQAGFSSLSGYVSSPTFGGISWLAHSTLQSGLWVNTQERYNQLVSANRLTLASAFKRAGWETVDDVPSDNRPWALGKKFYGFDKVYDRYQVGYKGPTFSFASMPDQYIFSALNRLVLAKPHKQPLFAEVDTVSSHEPWTSIPEEIPWNKVGNGSIYKTLPVLHASRGNATEEQTTYGKSIAYSLDTITSFVRRYGGKNLVMIVLGDHQPQPIVSGLQPNHDVPISVISHDPAVLQQIKGWGWTAGLRPANTAPVWPMSAFRNRFLNAFDKPAGTAAASG